MPVKYELESSDIAVFRVSGILKFDEFAAAQQECKSIINRVGHVKMLILTDGFEGWENSEHWGDWSFSEENDPFIEKIAIIAEEKWKDLLILFSGKGLRPVSIELFDPKNETQARVWLEKEI